MIKKRFNEKKNMAVFLDIKKSYHSFKLIKKFHKHLNAAGQEHTFRDLLSEWWVVSFLQ